MSHILRRTEAESLSWLLDGLVAAVPEAEYCVLLTVDGLLFDHNSSVGRDDAERLAAIASGLVAMPPNNGRGGTVQVVVQQEDGLMVVCPGGHGSRLVAVATKDADAERLGFEMAQLAKAVGPAIGTTQRAPADRSSHDRRTAVVSRPASFLGEAA